MSVSLHLATAFDPAWENVLRPWFGRVAPHAFEQTAPVAVVTPFRSQAQLLRSKLLGCGISLLGVRFLVPAQLCEVLLRDTSLKLPLREHLRLLLAVTAEQFAIGNVAEEQLLVAKSIARDPNRFPRALDELRGAGWSFDEIESPALREIAARFDQQVHDVGFTFVQDADRAALAHAREYKPLFGDLLLFGFDAAQWALWPLLHAGAMCAATTTVVLSDPRDEARELDETWVGTWEETFGPAEVIPTTETTSPSLLESPVPMASGDIHFAVGRDTTQQARAIVALAAKFLADRACERLAIVFSGPGALARLVATFLESAGITHNDSLAHLAPSAFDDDAWRAWLELQETPRLKPLSQFLRATEGKMFDRRSVSQVIDTLRRAYNDLLIDDLELLRDYCEQSHELRHGDAAARHLQQIQFLPASASLPEFLLQTRSIFSTLRWKERWNEVERLSRHWSDRFTLKFSKAAYLRWLQELLGTPSLESDELGA